MKTDLIPQIETPSFLISSTEDTVIIIFVAIFFVLISLFFSRVKTSFKLLKHLNQYKNNVITARGLAYTLTPVLNKAFKTPSNRFTQDDINNITNIKYNHSFREDRTKFISLVYKTIIFTLLGKN